MNHCGCFYTLRSFSSLKGMPATVPGNKSLSPQKLTQALDVKPPKSLKQLLDSTRVGLLQSPGSESATEKTYSTLN